MSGWVLYRRIFQYLRNYWTLFAVSIISMALAAATEPAFVALLKPLVDQGFVGKNRVIPKVYDRLVGEGEIKAQGLALLAANAPQVGRGE